MKYSREFYFSGCPFIHGDMPAMHTYTYLWDKFPEKFNMKKCDED